MAPAVTTRAATAQDDAFLFALFRAVHSPDFTPPPLPTAQLDILMRVQYAGQNRTYGAQYPDGHQIVLLDGRPIGRLWLFLGQAEHRLVDISLLPEFRSRGIGTALVAEAVAAARAAGVNLCCSVAATNHGSLRFHQRLGFQIVGRDEVYCHLAYGP